MIITIIIIIIKSCQPEKEKTLQQESELIQLQQKVEAKKKELNDLYATLQKKNQMQHEALQVSHYQIIIIIICHYPS